MQIKFLVYRVNYGIRYTRTEGDCKYLEVARIMHQSILAAPRFSPPPRGGGGGLLRGICLPCLSPEWGICAIQGTGICLHRGDSQAFHTHAVCYQNITTKRILLEKQAYWLFCKGEEKLKTVVKACSRSYACISSLPISSQNYIAKSGAIDVTRQRFGVKLNQISVDMIGRRTSFHISKTMRHNI